MRAVKRLPARVRVRCVLFASRRPRARQVCPFNLCACALCVDDVALGSAQSIRAKTQMKESCDKHVRERATTARGVGGVWCVVLPTRTDMLCDCGGRDSVVCAGERCCVVRDLEFRHIFDVYIMLNT